MKDGNIRETLRKYGPIVQDRLQSEYIRTQAAAAIINAIKPLIRYAISPVSYSPPVTREELEAECQNEVFLRLESVLRADNPSAYIISMCRRYAIKYANKNRPLSQADPEKIEDIIDDTEETSTDWLDDFHDQNLANFVRTLPEDDQRLLYDVCVLRKSQSAIAREKGVNRSTIKRRIDKLLSAAKSSLS